MPTSIDITTVLGTTPEWQPLDGGELPELQPGEVHLWCAPLTLSDTAAEKARQWLNDHQRDRYERRPIGHLKMAYLAGRYFLLSLLAHYTNTTPEKISLTYSRLSKPLLDPNPDGLAFNFTDSTHGENGVGLFAFYYGSELGVDLEALNRRGNFSTVAKRKFTAREQALMRRFDGELDAERFLALWTRKEAYGKAKGVGVNFKMNQLDLASPDQHHLSFLDTEGEKRYQLHQFHVTESHIGSLVYGADNRLELKTFSLAPEDDSAE